MMNNLKQMLVKLAFVLVLLIPVAGIVNAEPVKSSNAIKIEYVDNTKGIVVINDQTFHLRLNTKISDINKRQLNRYALKVGQSVKYNSSYENKRNYIDSILIVSN